MNTTRSRWPPAWPEITDPLVLDAMASVPRHLFVPPGYQDQAYEDAPLPIGLNQTISQPFIVALMTQALRSATTAACWKWAPARATRPPSSRRSRRTSGASRRCPCWPRRRASVSGGWGTRSGQDGRRAVGLARACALRCDRRHRRAGNVPPALVQQLGPQRPAGDPAGRGPVGSVAVAHREARDGRLRAERLGEVRFVPLIGSARTGPEDAELAAIRDQLRVLLRR